MSKKIDALVAIRGDKTTITWPVGMFATQGTVTIEVEKPDGRRFKKQMNFYKFMDAIGFSKAVAKKDFFEKL
jgi:hypothetical protein